MRAVFAWSILITSSISIANESILRQGADFVGRPVTPVVINIEPASLPAPDIWRPGDPIKEIPIVTTKNNQRALGELRPVVDDPLLAMQFAGRNAAAGGGSGLGNQLVNIDGSNFAGRNPSDTVGDVGIDHYVQLINHSQGSNVRVVDKATGSLLQFFILDSLAIGSGTGCVSGRGDPIVMFDESVDNGPSEPNGRWILAEFTITSINSLCVYVSQTSDPTTGDWFLYEFDSITGQIPDYPKYGVWPNAYFLGVNEQITELPGPHQYALDRERMLAGVTARPLQAFIAPKLPGFGFQHIMPVDWDGIEPPPPDAPGLFIRHRDTEIHGPSAMPDADILELFEFSVNFNSPGSSTFTGPINIPMAEFDSEFCDLVFSGCLQQPDSSTRLFALLQPIMWRAQYRNFGSHQSIVSNMVTDVTGDDIAAVRWFELRSLDGDYQTYQQGTISEPGAIDGTDGINRWMASVAQDQAGNIVAGYNVAGLGDVNTNDDVFPGMRYSGRLLNDPLDSMPQGEFSIIEGQFPNAGTRYGDYSALTVDPVDSCTFWYTAQYNPLANNNWATRIAAFRFDDCGDPGFILAADNLQQQVCASASLAPITINVGSVFGFSDPVTLELGSSPSGVNASFSPNPVSPGNTTVANLTVGAATPTGLHFIELQGTAGSADQRNINVAVTVFNQVPAMPMQTSPVNGQALVSTQPVLSWTGDVQTGEYIIEIDDDPGFGSINYTATVTGLSHTPFAPLDNDQLYFWRIRASNACDITVSQILSFTTRPAIGECSSFTNPNIIFFDDIENGDNGWTHEGTNDTWQQSSLETTSGNFAWFAEDIPIVSDQRLISPTIALPSDELPIELIYLNSQTIEDDFPNDACWDAGIIEISTDDGMNWTQLIEPRLVTDPYDGVVNNSVDGTNPLIGLQGWCGDPQNFAESNIDLSDFAGETVRFRFRLGTDGSLGRDNDGWFIDDVLVQSCAGGEDILSDGFEQLIPPRF